MHSDLHRYLDGELDAEALPPDLSADAAEWDALLNAAAPLGAERAPPWLEARVMSALPSSAHPARWRRAISWLLEPQPVRLRPIGVALAAVAATFLIAVWPAPAPPGADPGVVLDPAAPTAVSAAAAAPIVYVQFVFASDDARSVAVAGDFNGWLPAANTLRDPDGDGVWTGLFALPAGLHKYMFVVDGERWVTDPRAERYVEDGFGMRNALIAVAPPVGRTS